MKWVVENLNAAGGFLLGRRTYEGFAQHWPNASEEEQPLAVVEGVRRVVLNEPAAGSRSPLP